MKSKSSKIPVSVSLVIPIFNSEDTAIPQIQQCDKILQSLCNKYEIIICDDKSTDNTASLLKKHLSNNKNVTLIFHKNNQGIAKTIFALYKMAKNDFIVLFSVDGDWVPDDIESLLRTAYTQQATIVVGVRKEKNYSLYRMIISFLYNFLPLILFKIQTYDAGSIKVIRKKLLDSLTIISKSVFFEAEIIIRAKKEGHKVIPCEIKFKKKNKHAGKGGNFSLALLAFQDAIKLRMHRL